MAQRAYRQRKDSALGEMKRKLMMLEKRYEDLCNHYTVLSGFILENEAFRNSPEILQQIKKATVDILSDARDFEDGSNKKHVDLTSRKDTTKGSLVDDAYDNSKAVPSSSDVNPLGPPASHPEGFESQTSLANRSTAGSENAQIHNAPILEPVASEFRAALNHSSDLNTGLIDSSLQNLGLHGAQTQQNSYLQDPSLTFISELPLPKSFASQERTFGRRLHRASQETGFLLATMKDPPPDWYLRVFGFCLHYETREEICRRMGDTIRKSRDKTLNNWKHPFINLGGAGLFYPDMNSAWQSTGVSMGPFSASIEETRDLRLDTEFRMLDPGFQGDFFDTDEVEIYLRNYGVTIPANKDVVTAFVDTSVLGEEIGIMSAQSNNQGPHNMPDTISVPPMGPARMGQASSTGGPEELSNRQYYDGFHGATYGAANLCPESFAFGGEHSTRSEAQKVQVDIDVECLITALVNMTVCLGRTPGIRPNDVRNSLRMSLTVTGAQIETPNQ
ncbi:unnamed protein product [Clonostachys rosea]|uniref:BZIP domain-containing protein n=1 Tax=Bionectria ochroleuca TaxID=29856 RepID=A0ABY6U499_BIOOC|nr:unnamed protein product [Clonostachys rosea]